MRIEIWLRASGDLGLECALGGMLSSVPLHQLFTNLLVNAARRGPRHDPG
jgi:hypothetical protein